HIDEAGKAHIRMTLGPEVQTLTRAMTAILCKGLDGSTPQEILDLRSNFVTRIVGTELVRLRSQTVYYVLTRIKSVCKVYLDRQRMARVACWRSASGRDRLQDRQSRDRAKLADIRVVFVRELRAILFATSHRQCAKIGNR